MQGPLPKRLRKAPVVLASCEIRTLAVAPLSSLLPGILFSQFAGEALTTENLPSSEVPFEIRSRHPALVDSPLVKIAWRGYDVLVGLRNVAIVCGVPYKGWGQFRQDLNDLLNVVFDSTLVKAVQRYSVKYVNFFPSEHAVADTSMLNWSISIGGVAVEKNAVNVHVERTVGEALALITIGAPAVLQGLVPIAKNGTVLDIDTICGDLSIDAKQFKIEAQARFDGIRQLNKKLFFECLTEATLAKLEPEYDAVH